MTKPDPRLGKAIALVRAGNDHERTRHKPLSKSEVRAMRPHAIKHCVVKINPPMEGIKG